MTGDGEILVERHGQVAVVRVYRPEKLNAVTPHMASRLRDHVCRLDTDPEVRALVLTGTGDRAFCVGSDIESLRDYDTPWDFRNRDDYADAIRHVRTPVVAAVNGYSYGGGLELALACDIRLAAATATFAAPEIKLGWIGGAGQAVGLAHSIGPSNAALMLLTGDPIDARTALEWGLVSQVVPPAELLSTAIELAGRIAARAPIAAETAKVNLRAAYAMAPEQAVRYERDLQAVCMATEDAREGRRAFSERREPKFHGR
ncbi:enoyl-CoA hydratase/isomerase family protein [Actinopolymorpha sp. B11F2]|uniref:enoyl-CoA hydratase/isomerase family protein n=1 Tax=Actinopolymorpha sp. B11F2 TaxID=3160862 RepID=UPI0032E4B581